jgi:hypothetical protein
MYLYVRSRKAVLGSTHSTRGLLVQRGEFCAHDWHLGARLEGLSALCYNVTETLMG